MTFFRASSDRNKVPGAGWTPVLKDRSMAIQGRSRRINLFSAKSNPI